MHFNYKKNTNYPHEISEMKKASSNDEAFCCGPTWARTMDPLIMSQVL